MGLSEKNKTAEVQYGPGFKPDTMSKTKNKKALVTRSKHRKQPFILTYDEHVNTTVMLRYANERNACIGAVRHYREWLESTGGSVDISLPGGRMRTGWIGGKDKKVVLGAVTNKKK